MFIEEVAHASTYITMCAACSKRKWLQHDCNESNYTKRSIIYITHWRTNGAYVGAAAATAGAGAGVALVVVTVVVVPAVAEVTVGMV